MTITKILNALIGISDSNLRFVTSELAILMYSNTGTLLFATKITNASPISTAVYEISDLTSNSYLSYTSSTNKFTIICLDSSGGLRWSVQNNLADSQGVGTYAKNPKAYSIGRI